MTRVLTTLVVTIGLLCALGAYVLDQRPPPTGVGYGAANGDLTSTCDIDGDSLDLTNDQADNAITIMAVAHSMDLPKRAAVIGLATALQESTLTNHGDLGAANDHDSLGLFQQRPSSGWGSPEELTDPEYAAKAFFTALVKVDGWDTMPLTQAAQAVQNSAFPAAYAQHEDTAQDIVDSLDCESTWVKPVDAGPVSPFRPADRPDHHGTDLGAARDTPIKAAAAGTVTIAACTATIADSSYGCDRDGSPTVQGCGWHVAITHPDNLMTVYCHMNEKPYVTTGDTVEAGEDIGVVGSTGNSSGPHLHLEVHDNHTWTPDSAIDPIPFFENKGVTW